MHHSADDSKMILQTKKEEEERAQRERDRTVIVRAVLHTKEMLPKLAKEQAPS
jgi:hypothetical protein